MKRKRYAEEQIVFALRQGESGTPIAEIVRKMGIAEQTYYRWKKKFAGMGVAEVRRLKQLEDQRNRVFLTAPKTDSFKTRYRRFQQAFPLVVIQPAEHLLELIVEGHTIKYLAA